MLIFYRIEFRACFFFLLPFSKYLKNGSNYFNKNVDKKIKLITFSNKTRIKLIFTTEEFHIEKEKFKSFYFAESSRVVYSQGETKRLSSAWCK